MTPPRRTLQSSQDNIPDIARAIEAMGAAMTQQSTMMMQQHETSMQRQTVSLEQQQLVMQQMEAARVAIEDAHQQHMEALCQLEETRMAALAYGPEPRPVATEWSLEDFLKHHPTMFYGKTSPDATDQWLKDLEHIFDAKMCPAENKLAFSMYMLTGEAEHWWISTKSILEERDEPVTWEAFKERFLSEKFKNDLRGDMRLMVAPLSIKDFATLVEKARVMEKIKHEVEGQQPQQPQRGRVQCYICGGPHLRSACPRMEGYRRCNNCGKEGHFGKDCPALARAATRPPVQTFH
ncbi:uncharacterized protein LOC114184337 [Vigna unguiculata]|uniref:uncharacterized protein LOC114184337 n=1 Tax=Vigna unguiculata TaxID=3917 RepID=UPI00101655D2|nr:uncharacterized protein LOC114184337 [Vigna unguiculata]